MKHGFSRPQNSIVFHRAIHFVLTTKMKLLFFLLHVIWTFRPCHVVAFSVWSHGSSSPCYTVQSNPNSNLGLSTKSNTFQFQVTSTRSFFSGPLFSQSANKDSREGPRRNQLVRVIDSILYYSEDDKVEADRQSNGSYDTYSSATILKAPDPGLLRKDHERFFKALKALKSAKHPSQVSQAGRLIQKELPTILEEEPRAIQERLLKALSLAGLIQQAMALLDGMLNETIREHTNRLPSSKKPPPQLPSYMSYTALCSALRKAGRIGALEKLLYRMAEVAASTSEEQIHVVALNIYLAALCDPRTSATSPEKEYYIKGDNLQRARNILKDPERTLKRFRVQLSTASYNTVLTAATRVGNRTLVNEIWEEFVPVPSLKSNTSSQFVASKTIQPDIRSYNARLLVTPLAERLTIWQEIQDKTDLIPDRYTVDLMLVPLLRNGQNDEAKGLIQAHMDPTRNIGRPSLFPQNDNDSTSTNVRVTAATKASSHAFSAFLTTLVQKGEAVFAQELFDALIVPNLPVSTSQTAITSSTKTDFPPIMVMPTTRHFNILINGYAQLANEVPLENRSNSDSGVLSTTSAAEETMERTKMAQFQGRRLFRLMQTCDIQIDDYTVTSMMGLCQTSQELINLLKMSTNDVVNGKEWRNDAFTTKPVIVRAAIGACGRLGDMVCAVAIFDHFVLRNIRTQSYAGDAEKAGSLSASSSATHPKEVKGNPRMWNVLLGAMAEGTIQGNARIEMGSFNHTMFEVFKKENSDLNKNIGDFKSISILVDGKTCTEAVRILLNSMRDTNGFPWAPVPNSQSYCISASALQYEESAGPDLAMEIFRNATESDHIPADGRLLNAIFRCFGDEIEEAITAWKTEIRQACVAFEKRPRREPLSSRRSKNKNLIAAYNGMLYVCGRALRPDIALRLAYAMNREGIEPNQNSMNCYQAGKRRQQELDSNTDTEVRARNNDSSFSRSRIFPSLLPQRRLVQQYENLLYVECTKYNERNKRMAKDRRVRIIV